MSSECLFLKHLVSCLRFLTVCIKSSVKRIVRSRKKKKKRTNFKHLLVFHLTARNAPHSLNETSCATIDTWTQLMVFDTKVSDAGSRLLESEFSSPQHKSPRAKSTRGYSHPGQSLGQAVLLRLFKRPGLSAIARQTACGAWSAGELWNTTKWSLKLLRFFLLLNCKCIFLTCRYTSSPILVLDSYTFWNLGIFNVLWSHYPSNFYTWLVFSDCDFIYCVQKPSKYFFLNSWQLDIILFCLILKSST